ncbi:MAG: 50S ribosomal protein L23 [Planctomycetes bacterium]|nr:50S ribosomal protein L23 [Planctomycetota bacterium]
MSSVRDRILSEYDIIKEPIFTEKAMKKNSLNQYVFRVDSKANKIQIRAAVEKIWNVKVEKVRTVWMRTKQKRFRYSLYQKPRWKKAIVILKEGSNLELI